MLFVAIKIMPLAIPSGMLTCRATSLPLIFGCKHCLTKNWAFFRFIIKLLEYDSELQSAAFNISVMPMFAVVIADALLVECAQNIAVSMTVAVNRDFSHLAMVLEDTALYGLIKAINSRFSLSLKSVVYFSYAFNVPTGHSTGFAGNDG